MWIKSKVQVESTKRPRKESTDDVQQNFSRHYFLSDQEDNEHAVCKIFFLQTLGYTSDKVITVTLKIARKEPSHLVHTREASIYHPTRSLRKTRK